VIIYRKGDIVKAFSNKEINTLAHGCNCQKVMGGGIARQISNKYPIVYDFDKKLKLLPEQRLGTINIVGIQDNYIINCYSQLEFGYGLQVDYEAIRSCMKQLNEFNKDNIILGMPKIGAGLGGGDWNIIEQIINNEIKGTVYVYEL
jgi:O-acetyl-ADP-ribose deacetylase (regulator of RNase III)